MPNEEQGYITTVINYKQTSETTWTSLKLK